MLELATGTKDQTLANKILLAKKIEYIGVPIIDHKELEELNIVQSWSGYPCKKANVFAITKEEK